MFFVSSKGDWQKKLESFEELLTRLTRLWALLHGLTAFLISDNVQWNNEWQLCLEKEFN